MKTKVFKILILSIVIMTILCSCYKSSNFMEVPVFNNKDILVVYTSHKEEVYGPIIDEFQARTGIWVKIVAGGTNELLEMIANESENVSADIVFGGGIDSLDSYSQYFQSYIYSEDDKLIQSYKSNENKWTVFSELPIVFVYNNKLVYEPEVPKGWNELLEDRWKGKIAFADPNKSGSSYTILNTFVQLVGNKDLNYLIDFYNILNGKILDGSGDVLNEVSSGTKLIGITLEETALKKIASGGDINIVYPIEGTSSVPDGAAIILNSPNQENAKLFMEFILSKDVQRRIVNEDFRRSVRNDISINSSWIKEEIKLMDFDLKWAIKNRNQILNIWNELIR